MLPCPNRHSGEHLDHCSRAGCWELELGCRIDYIMVRCTERRPTLHITACRRLSTGAGNGVWVSDHFGVAAELSARPSSGRPVL
jgi:endonuclease/exonuclease/phosphatase family metal-dependent hydrolase